MKPDFLLSIYGDDFTMSVRDRASKAALRFTGSIIPYADGSLLRGRVIGSQLTAIFAGLLAFLMLLAVLACQAGFSVRTGTPGIGWYLGALLLALCTPRIGFSFHKLNLLRKLRGCFAAWDISPAVAQRKEPH